MRTSVLVPARFNLPLMLLAGLAIAPAAATAQDVPITQGYYRQPALHRDTVVFIAEGDLWKVPASGGAATRLTTHLGDEYAPQISPDGKWLAFCAEYEGPAEVYVMPMEGGMPARLTFEGAGRVSTRGWTADGKVTYSTDRYSTLPNSQLATIDPATRTRTMVPLAQAFDGAFGEGGKLFFVRIPFNGSHTKRYKGGTIEQVWSWSGKDGEEAINLTGDFEGTSRRPMLWNGRVYFASDRDGYMNIWSVTPDGKDLKQHSKNTNFDMAGTNIDAAGSGRIVYQLGPDLRLHDLAANTDTTINITLPSDFDQLREKWITKPVDWVTAASLSPDGDRVVLTARGEIVVAPARQGRLVEATRKPGVRYRNATFSSDGLSVIALSDQSGEVEVWKLPANGIGEAEQLTTGADVLRWSAQMSPDGKSIAHNDKNHKLWIYDVATKQSVLVEQNLVDQIESFTWSKDGRWLAYVAAANNAFPQIKIYSLDSKTSTAVTTDRFASYSPAWSPDGNWLYFLSDRELETLVSSPWGQNQPDPFLDKTTKIFAVALKPGVRWPYLPKDELEAAKDKKKDEKKEEKKEEPKKEEKHADAKAEGKPDQPKTDEAKKDEPKKDEAKKDEPKKDEPKKVEIVLDGIRERLYEVPVAKGNYGNLNVTDKAIFFTSRDTDPSSPTNLQSFPISNDSPEQKTVVDAINGYQFSQDGKKILVRKGDTYSIIDANPGKADLEKKNVDLSGWRLSLPPREEFRQMYTESWRLLRDYFYDPGMHGVNWKAMHDKYLPWVERVRARAELSDIMTHLTGELSALHHFVRDGDTREGTDQIPLSSLGCVLTRDDAKGGYVISDIYENDPDEPSMTAPIARPHVAGKEGDVIEMIDGVPVLTVQDPAALLRAKAGRQVLIRIKPAAGGDSRDAIVTPISLGAESDLRYHSWEYTRRLKVDELSKNQIGYLHLRAMGGSDFTNFVKGYYPVFDRQGLIIDVRNNRGGNIDSWILSKLMRKAWMTWSQRVGQAPNWNMQYAFRGHMILLCNERTASDGEAIADGFRRLGLGKVLGTRTWGGEIWLTSSNTLVDRGIATAGEFGVWGPEGTWLIEGRGVEPDIVIDNPPHATFKGEDAQLKAAVDYLQKLIAEKPIPPVERPAYPDKSFRNK